MLATERGIWNMIALLPQIRQLRATALDALYKHVVTLVMMHFEYILLKKHGDITNLEALLHPDFIKRLASCTTTNEFEALANATKEYLQLPQHILTLINKVRLEQYKNEHKNYIQYKFKTVTYDGMPVFRGGELNINNC